MGRKIVLSLVSVALLSAGWLGLSGVGLLVALVPLMMISATYDGSRRSAWRMFGWAALVMGLWSVVTSGWLIHIHFSIALLAAAISVTLFGGAFMIYHYVSKRAPKALAYTMFVTAWIAMEYLYTLGEISFPWLTLGNGFGGDIKLVQWYDTTGVFGGSLWVLVVNILFFEALTSARRGFVRWASPAVFALVPIAVSLVRYCTYTEKGQTVSVAVVQPNINAWFKWGIPQREQTDKMIGLTREAPAGTQFIVYPETAIYEDIVENHIDRNRVLAEFREVLRSEYPQAQMILGASTEYYFMPGEKISETARQSNGVWYNVYNAALGIDTTDVTQIHHKSKLVIGAEKMPYYRIMKYFEPIIKSLGGITGQYSVDDYRAVFTSPGGVKSAAPICWEAVFGQYCGEFVRGGAQIFFVISNDGWWGDTRGHKQLFLYSRLRAVESRRAIARSANTGTSGLIDQRGEVLAKVGWDKEALIPGELALNDHVTFYTKYGDYVARLCSYVFGLSVLYFIAYRVRRRNRLVE